MNKRFSAALIGTVMMSAPVMAWAENMTQPASNDIAVWAYEGTSANYCPAGLQPVVVGGVVCCGVATYTGYQSHPAAPRKTYKPAATVVSYGKGYGETVVYEKGQ